MSLDSSGTARSLSVYPIPDFGCVRVDGQDAVKVVNGLCTADLKRLEIGRTCEAFFTDDRGWVMTHSLVARDDAGLVLCGMIPDAAKLAQHIDRFIFREDAVVRQLSQEQAAWIVELKGEAAPAVDDPSAVPADSAPAIGVAAARSLTGDFPCELIRLIGPDIAVVSVGGVECLMYRCPMLSEEYKLIVAPTSSVELIEERLWEMGARVRRELAEFEQLRIRHFWPRAKLEIGEKTLPQELDRDATAISFTKGCYLGQETVARLDALGQVQKKLCQLEIAPGVQTAAGDSITKDGKDVGRITSVVLHNSAQPGYALAYLRRGNFEAGTELIVNEGTARVIKHP